MQVAVRFIVGVDGGVDVGVSGPPAYFELGYLRPAPDPTHPDEQNAMLADYQKPTGVPFTNRTPEQIAAWLDGLQIQPPGLVPIDEWRPAPETEREPMLLTYGVLARKPIDG
ncbi:SAM-dependent methyltransferase [Streptomyces atratus]|uniref:SAM-dependent methyltransferase n=1 Tax=Streptomyces atratus TaxID=1893 RepID=UPI003795DFA7